MGEGEGRGEEVAGRKKSRSKEEERGEEGEERRRGGGRKTESYGKSWYEDYSNPLALTQMIPYNNNKTNTCTFVKYTNHLLNILIIC